MVGTDIHRGETRRKPNTEPDDNSEVRKKCIRVRPAKRCAREKAVELLKQSSIECPLLEQDKCNWSGDSDDVVRDHRYVYHRYAKLHRRGSDWDNWDHVGSPK
jgi:hypothetical protein